MSTDVTVELLIISHIHILAFKLWIHFLSKYNLLFTGCLIDHLTSEINHFHS